jgi:hypothetical protein
MQNLRALRFRVKASKSEIRDDGGRPQDFTAEDIKETSQIFIDTKK